MTIRCPTLFIRDDEGNPDNYPAERFKKTPGRPMRCGDVENCDHFYVGRAPIVSGLGFGVAGEDAQSRPDSMIRKPQPHEFYRDRPDHHRCLRSASAARRFALLGV